ncbi:acetate--CoA ligase family protein, partial [Streptomyces sp. NPDC055078]
GSGGVGILMADAASECSLDVSAMPESAGAKLLELLPFAGVANPIDVTAQVGNEPHLFGSFLKIVMDEGGYDALVVFLGHLGLSRARTERLRPQLKAMRDRYPDRTIVLSMLTTPEIRADFVADGFVMVEDPSDAVEVVAALARMAELRAAAPAAVRPAADVPAMPREVVGEYGALRLLATAGLPVSVGSVVTSVNAAVAVAAGIGRPVAMKVASPRIPHKSDIGGVLLDVEGEGAASRAYQVLVDRAAAAAPGAEHDGVLIAPMVAGGVELLAGIHNDPVIGPVVVLGQGGVTAELHGGAAMRVPPFGPDVARSMMKELACWPLLEGYRGSTPADTEALATVLVRLSELAVGWREDIASLDINPLVVLDHGDGVIALDALIVPRDLSDGRSE